MATRAVCAEPPGCGLDTVFNIFKYLYVVPPSELQSLKADLFRALGHPARIRILELLASGERTVQELCKATGTSQANASKHLALLLERGLVARRRDGAYVHYRIADPTLQQLCRRVCGSLADRHEAVRASLAS